VLDQHKDGLSRTEIAGQSGGDVLATIEVKRDELAAKLRQPLGELVGNKKLHTVGEKRLMKYHAGEAPGGPLARCLRPIVEHIIVCNPLRNVLDAPQSIAISDSVASDEGLRNVG